MMGQQVGDQGQLFYLFNLEEPLRIKLLGFYALSIALLSLGFAVVILRR